VRGGGRNIERYHRGKFMEKYDRREALPPRDIVARGIFEEWRTSRRDLCYLDLASHMKAEHIKERFPHLQDLSWSRLDIRKNDTRPPTAHYFCGGIKVDIDGRTSLKILICGREKFMHRRPWSEPALRHVASWRLVVGISLRNGYRAGIKKWEAVMKTR